MDKSTLVIGASLNEMRFSNRCVRTLVADRIPVQAIGLQKGEIAGVEIQTGLPELNGIHTVTLYLGPDNQKPFYDYIVRLKPSRVIFNPGSENEEFQDMLTSNGIEVTEDCTLMMVQGGRY